MSPRFLLLISVTALAITGCGWTSRTPRASPGSAPTVCYKLDSCTVALLVMSTQVERIRRTTGDYPKFTKEDEAKNGHMCSSGKPFRYGLVLQDGTALAVCCDDAPHEGFHVAVYGVRHMLFIPELEYQGFVNELAAGRFARKKDWLTSIDAIRHPRKSF